MDAVALNLHRRRESFDALVDFVGDMLGNRAIVRWEHDALIALVQSLRTQDPTTAQDRQRHGFVEVRCPGCERLLGHRMPNGAIAVAPNVTVTANADGRPSCWDCAP